jgi:hypothetical protein
MHHVYIFDYMYIMYIYIYQRSKALENRLSWLTPEGEGKIEDMLMLTPWQREREVTRELSEYPHTSDDVLDQLNDPSSFLYPCGGDRPTTGCQLCVKEGKPPGEREWCFEHSWKKDSALMMYGQQYEETESVKTLQHSIETQWHKGLDGMPNKFENFSPLTV